MRVLHLSTSLAGGGAEATLFRLLSRTDRRRFDPVVVSLSAGGVYAEQIEALGIPVYSLGMSPGLPNPWAAVRLNRLVRRIEPDLIHAWMYHAALLGLAVVRSRPAIIAIHHALHDIKGEKFLTRQTIKYLARMSERAASVVYCANAARVQHEAIGYAPARGVVIPNGFDCDVFRPTRADRQSLRAELGLSEASFVVGHVGRYHKVKDHATLVDAFSRIARVNAQARLVMAGAGVDTGNAELVANIERLGLRDHVVLLGQRNDIPKLLNVFDVLVSSSRSEAFPNVLGEAMACGVPCVATDVGDSAHIVGHAGLVVPPRQPDAMAEAIERIMMRSQAERDELGRVARARIVEEFSLDRIVDRYARLHEQTVGLARSASGNGGV